MGDFRFGRREAAKIGLVNVNVVFSERIFNEQVYNGQGLVGGDANPTRNRILDGDILLTPIPESGLNSMDDDGVVAQYTEVVSVINGLGKPGDKKDKVLNGFIFGGIANGSAESHSIGSGSATAIAATRQGRISVTNRYNHMIQPGSRLMVDIPRDTAHAELMAQTTKAHGDGNVPEKRYTAFFRPVKKGELSSLILEDIVDKFKSTGPRPANAPAHSYNYSFSQPLVEAMRMMFALGAVAAVGGTAARQNGGNLAAQRNAAVGAMRLATAGVVANNGAANAPNDTVASIEDIISGRADFVLAAMLDPTAAGGNALPGGGGNAGYNLQQDKMNAFLDNKFGVKQLMSNLENAIMEAGKKWTVATAETGARPGDKYAILLRS